MCGDRHVQEMSANTLEAAKTEFEANWHKWLEWAKLSERS
jgi:hypothetical protein